MLVSSSSVCETIGRGAGKWVWSPLVNTRSSWIDLRELTHQLLEEEEEEEERDFPTPMRDGNHRGRQRGTRKSLSSFLLSFFLPGRGNKEVDPLLKKTQSRQYRIGPTECLRKHRVVFGIPRRNHGHYCSGPSLLPEFFLLIAKDQGINRILFKYI